MQATIVVTKASVNNGWRNIVDQGGVRYSLSKKGNVPDLYVGQTVTIDYTEKQSDDGKFTNRYITGWTLAGGGGPAHVSAPLFKNPYETPLSAPKPQETGPRALADDPKGDSMAKMNAMNNAVAIEIAKVNFYASLVGPAKPEPMASFREMEMNVWVNAGKIYQALTGKGWPEIETRKIADEENVPF